MSIAGLASCMSKAVKAGQITKSDADEILEYAKKAARDRFANMGDAERRAVEDALARAGDIAAENRRVVALQIARVSDVRATLEAHPKGRLAAAMGVLSHDVTGQSRVGSVEARGQAIESQALAEMSKVVEAYRHKH
ncbi:hypothetical protein FACS1894205_4390 [Alphaproteobacteria bacterium]|nr:hypothetical protein FACS1894205_4390 [Alphaproteobacteria bacterium]